MSQTKKTSWKQFGHVWCPLNILILLIIQALTAPSSIFPFFMSWNKNMWFWREKKFIFHYFCQTDKFRLNFLMPYPSQSCFKERNLGTKSKPQTALVTPLLVCPARGWVEDCTLWFLHIADGKRKHVPWIGKKKIFYIKLLNINNNGLKSYGSNKSECNA